ncbi:MAG: hypothetical protein BMS9Abin06_0136 [Gammaproteobacteria bacterium]|nr:MAG: hypothetical protein BMS9Abin06_0136 [Gammaproteobacteria bacterium]
MVSVLILRHDWCDIVHISGFSVTLDHLSTDRKMS